MHVALDRGEQHAATRLHLTSGLFGLHEGLQIGHGRLHGARALDHLGQEHLARAEQIAHHRHAGHQGSRDHVKRPAQLLPRLLGVRFDEIHHTVDQGVLQTLLYGRLPP